MRVPLLLLLTLAGPSLAAELEIRFGALERIIGEQMFTQEGRRYVRGSRTLAASTRTWNRRAWATTTTGCA